MRVQLVITLENGDLTVDGPLEQKLQCLGLLELAKEVVKAYEPPKVKAATGEVPRN